MNIIYELEKTKKNLTYHGFETAPKAPRPGCNPPSQPDNSQKEHTSHTPKGNDEPLLQVLLSLQNIWVAVVERIILGGGRRFFGGLKLVWLHSNKKMPKKKRQYVQFVHVSIVIIFNA